MEIFFLLFIFLYALLLLSMKRHWQLKQTSNSNGEYGASTALLIPFRNEAEHLPKLLLNLKKILHSSQEVVFIDDDSADDSAAMVWDFLKKRNLNHWVLLKSAGPGKKAALTTGVQYSQAEIILTTDADCLLPHDWVRRMTWPFQQSETQLVAGPVMTVGGSGFFSRFQQIEWGSILLVTRYLFSIGKPLMCSGANLAYRRSAFLAVKGYSDNEMYPSGDDEFLLKKVVQHFGVQAAMYLNDKEVLVETQPAANWSAFVQQRVRWAGKWRLHRSFVNSLSSASAFFLATVELATIMLLFGSIGPKLVFLFIWVLKILIERRVLGKVLADFYRSHPIYYYIGTSFLHPIYVVWVGLGTISGKYTWKGRNNQFKF